MICDYFEAEGDQCEGTVLEVEDPFLVEIHEEYVLVQLCRFHYDERCNEI